MMDALPRVFQPITSAMSSLGVLVWPAYLGAAFLLALWFWRGGKPIAIAAVFWLAYAVYETLMSLRVLCSGDCNIRIDLLLIYPLLFISGVAACLFALRNRPTPR